MGKTSTRIIVPPKLLGRVVAAQRQPSAPSAIFQASASGEFSTVRKLITEGTDINLQDTLGKSPLIWAAMYGHPRTVVMLVDLGADLHLSDAEGKTALIWAAINGHSVTVKALIEAGAHSDAKDLQGWTALDHALGKSHERVVALLTPAAPAASEASDLEAVQRVRMPTAELLAIKPSSSSNEVPTSSPHKLYHKSPQEIMVQISSGKSDGGGMVIESTCEMPLLDKLHELRDRFEAHLTYLSAVILPLLLEGRICLEDGDHLELLELPIEDVLDVAQAEQLLNDCLHPHAPVAATEPGPPPVAITASGPPEPPPLPPSDAGLLRAAMEGRAMSVKTLLEKGADIEARLPDGWTPLMLATWNGHTDVVRSLIARGARTEAKTDLNWTPAMIAAWTGHTDIMRILITHNADVEAKDTNGKNVLMWACQKGVAEIVRLLLQKGVNVNAKNTDGWSAAAYAMREGHEEILRILKEEGSPNWKAPHDTTDWTPS